MKPLSQLINEEEPGWELVLQWIKDATNPIKILPKENEAADQALHSTQVTTQSPMGAIIYETGGILIDHGWIRIIGSGSNELKRKLPDWNIGKSVQEVGVQAPYFLVADDVIGGFFAINGGGLGSDFGQLYYFAPDSLEWEAMEINYSEFICWAFSGDLEQFYSGFRWTDWKNEVKLISGNEALTFFPYLWTKYNDIEGLKRKAVSIDEIWNLQLDFQKQING